MIELKKLSAGQFLYKKDENGITKAVVISSGPDSAMLVLIVHVDETGYIHQFETSQKYLLTNEESLSWFLSFDTACMSTKDNESNEWLICIGGSATDDVFVSKFTGTEKEAVKRLMKIITDGQKEDDFDHGTKKLGSLTHDKRGYYGYNVFLDHHIDYRLTKVSDIEELS